jgi:hypothetical protein
MPKASEVTQLGLCRCFSEKGFPGPAGTALSRDLAIWPHWSSLGSTTHLRCLSWTLGKQEGSQDLWCPHWMWKYTLFQPHNNNITPFFFLQALSYITIILMGLKNISCVYTFYSRSGTIFFSFSDVVISLLSWRQMFGEWLTVIMQYLQWIYN